jgi:DsbC/DsbD-like thiol-disulfide interchange protein
VAPPVFVYNRKTTMTKPLLLTIVATAMLAVPSVRAALDAEPTTTKHLSLTTSTSVSTVAPGGRVSLVVEITPKPNMHVYAPGQADVIPVSLTLAASDAAVSQPLQFPKAEKLEIKELGETHLVYSKPFRLVQDVTVVASRSLAKRAATPGATLTVKGTLRYQACDNTICYAPVNVPVAWTLALQSTGADSVKKPQR